MKNQHQTHEDVINSAEKAELDRHYDEGIITPEEYSEKLYNLLVITHGPVAHKQSFNLD